MTTQKRNAGMVDLLSVDFQRRREPNFALGNMISTALMLYELRGLWAASVVDENGALRDLAQQGRTLTNNGAAGRSVEGLVPYVSYDGATQYHARADEAGLDITGALTVGCWVKPNTTDGTMRGLVTKTVPVQESFYLGCTNTQTRFFVANVPGASFSQVDGRTMTSTWEFVVGRFIPSTEIAIFVTGTWYRNNVGIVPSIFNSTTALEIARLNLTNARCFNGRVALAFLCASALSDAAVNNLFQQSRAAFGV